MSYCVHCGVELDPSQKACPLCDTTVIDPRQPWSPDHPTPYPRELETLPSIDRKYVASLIGIISLIPILLSIISELFTGHTIHWSAYVAGGVALAYVWGVLPLYGKEFSPAFLAIDCLAAALYLLLIERLSGGNWFLPLALPLVCCVTVFVMGFALWFFYRRRPRVLLRISSLFAGGGFLAVCIDLILGLYLGAGLRVSWSVFVLIPMVGLSMAMLVLNRSRRARDHLRRRLFL